MSPMEEKMMAEIAKQKIEIKNSILSKEEQQKLVGWLAWCGYTVEIAKPKQNGTSNMTYIQYWK